MRFTVHVFITLICLLLLLPAVLSAQVQNPNVNPAIVVASCGTPPATFPSAGGRAYQTIDVNGNLCSSATLTGMVTIGDINLTGINGTAPDTNSGVKSAGTLRIVLATDQPALTNSLNVICVSGCSGGTQDTDDGTVAGGQTTGLQIGMTYMWNGSAWVRFLGNATDGALVNLGANNDVTVTGSLTTVSTVTAVTTITNPVTITSAQTGSGTATGAIRVELPTNGTGTIATVGTVTTVGAVTAITNALPAGTNAIGKLSANSGIDIGDVDVTSEIPGVGATNLGKAEDAAHTTGDTGVFALAVRNDALGTTFTNTNGDYSPLAVTSTGVLRVDPSGTTTQPVSGTVAATQSGTWNVTNAGIFVVQDTVAGGTTVTTTMQSAATGSGNGTVLATDGMSFARLTINCSVTCSGGTTVVFTAQNDGTNFRPIFGIKDDGTIASTATPTAIESWVFPLNGAKQLRAAVATYSAGTLTVIGTANPLGGNLPPYTNVNVTGNTIGLATDASIGATTDSAASAGGVGSLSAKLRLATSQYASMVTSLDTLDNAAGATFLRIAGTSGAAIEPITDPCDGSLAITVPVSVTADTVLISAVSAKKNYICSGLLVASSTSEIINIREGTGSTCGTSAAAIVGSTTAANGVTLAATGGGFSIPKTISGIGTNVDTCIDLSGSNRVSGYITYVQN